MSAPELGRVARHVRPRSERRATRWRVALLALVAVLAGYVLMTLAARNASSPHPTLAAAWPAAPLVIAHRGGAGLWPESTRLGFDAARALGVDVLELDVHLASDGELVVLHDDTVDRTTNGEGAVVTFTSEALANLDAGVHWVVDGATPYAGLGQGVPRLVDVLADHPGVPMLIELKPDGEAAAVALCELLAETGRREDVVVGSFHAGALKAFRSSCPQVATGASPSEVRNFLILARLRLAGTYRPRFDVLQVPVRQGGIEIVTPSLISAAHAKGVGVHVWTINDRDEMQRLLDLGVDGIISDRPDRTLEVLGRAVKPSIVPAFVEP